MNEKSNNIISSEEIKEIIYSIEDDKLREFISQLLYTEIKRTFKHNPSTNFKFEDKVYAKMMLESYKYEKYE